MELRTCKRCNKELPEDMFYRRKQSKSGWDCNCKECRNAINKVSQEKNKREKTPEEKAKAVAAVNKWREKNREKAREYNRRSAKNMSKEQRDAMNARKRELYAIKKDEKAKRKYSFMLEFKKALKEL
ncbi:MAG: hypothetical protein ACRDDH_11890 [Cetobacterium sp.]|uniref:hypothetical protein n=1 Tax=Cetobacterium sp. TaxID=2071632 RepID=UPI003EE810AE